MARKFRRRLLALTKSQDRQKRAPSSQFPHIWRRYMAVRGDARSGAVETEETTLDQAHVRRCCCVACSLVQPPC